ncbi:ABC transporter ATP-binding protein [Actinopolymorpha alba]|uniref:ABC transporter ATP-binding protein n=1 Tax=Actinopolymorpha alba TaxID=533267 RepID=UPI00036CE9B4|nr:ABC transporter ATP-binding protein [Actinopolymorpha alba]
MTATVTAPLGIRAHAWGFRHAGRRAWAIRDLDLTVDPGERVLLAGPSGAGKSTLLTALAGLLDPDQSGETAGSLAVDGVPPARIRERIGLVFQDPESQLVMARAGDDVAFGLENHAVPADQIWPRVEEALRLTGFPYGPDHPTGRLSGGEKQRLVLAGVVALRPSLLLLDEPTANLDPDGAALVRQAVGQIVAETGATLVVVDHRVDDWLPLIDRVMVLGGEGGVLAEGDPGKVFAADSERLAAAGVWVPGRLVPPRQSSTGMREPLLAAERLTYTYPGAAGSAVADASLTLRGGEAVAVTGPNGSGKSTLAMMLAGLLTPTSGVSLAQPALRASLPDLPRRGRRTTFDRPLHRWPANALVRAVGTVFQDPEHQFLTPNVRAELALGPRMAGSSPAQASARVDELLERLHLSHLAGANPFTLSGGEKRRLSVATTLATEPKVLVLDEPTFGQDRRTWLELLHLLADLRDEGHAVCAVSHDLDFVSALADRELRVRTGQLVAQKVASGAPGAKRGRA